MNVGYELAGWWDKSVGGFYIKGEANNLQDCKGIPKYVKETHKLVEFYVKVDVLNK